MFGALEWPQRWTYASQPRFTTRSEHTTVSLVLVHSFIPEVLSVRCTIELRSIEDRGETPLRK